MKAPKRTNSQPKMFQIIDMEELIPQKNILRQIDQVLDLSIVHEWTAPLYSSITGRNGADPEIALRMMLLTYLFDHSEREFFETLPMHAGYLWFCGLDFESLQKIDSSRPGLSDRTTLVKIRKLWRENNLYDDLMRYVVNQCITAGLVKTNVNAAVDGSQVRANASIHRLKEIQIAPVLSIEDYLVGMAQDDGGDQEKNQETSSSPSIDKKKEDIVQEDFHGKKFSNQTHRSTSDPDARLYKKGAQKEAFLSYLVNDLIDTESGVILDRTASPASSEKEREVSLRQLETVRFRHPEITIKTLSADKGYGVGNYLTELKSLDILSLVSLRNLTIEELPVYQRATYKPEQQAKREALIRKIQINNEAKQIQLDGDYQAIQTLRIRIEHGFAEAKNCHGLDRARSRGLERLQEQATLTAVIQNMKRLCKFRFKKPRTCRFTCALSQVANLSDSHRPVFSSISPIFGNFSMRFTF